MNETIFETKRLFARAWNLDTDIQAAFEIYGDLEVIRFLGIEPDESIEVTRQQIQEHLELADDDDLWYAVVEKASGQVIGAALLAPLYDKKEQQLIDDCEIGWHFRKLSWGNGYAAEIGQALINYGLNELKFPSLYAVITPTNIASIRVAQKLGMTHIGPTDRFYDDSDELFIIEK
jgi:[ribosomal protein S5]-alanine N-acetyltransferase